MPLRRTSVCCMRAISCSSAGSFSPAAFLWLVGAIRYGIRDDDYITYGMIHSQRRRLLEADPLVDDARLLEQEQHAVHLVQALSAGALDAQLVRRSDAVRVVQLALR